jgi:hypothetical protein
MTAANEEIILITRADDFGYSHSGNVGILDSLRFGIIRSAAILTIAPGLKRRPKWRWRPVLPYSIADSAPSRRFEREIFLEENEMTLPRAGSIHPFMRIALLIGLSLCLLEPSFPQEVHLVVSSKAGDRLTSKPIVHFVKGGTPPWRSDPDSRRCTLPDDGWLRRFLSRGWPYVHQ